MKRFAIAVLFAVPGAAQIVKVAPYYTPGAGTQALTTAATTDTSVDVLASGAQTRTLMPFSGQVLQFAVYLGDTSDLNTLYFSRNTCTTAVANACTVFTPTYAAAITGPFTANSLNTFTLAAPLTVSKWDALAIRAEWSQPHSINLALLASQLFPVVDGNGQPTQAETCYYQLNAAKPGTFTLSGMTLIPNAGCPVIGAYMTPPQAVGIGDSIMGTDAPAPSDSVADVQPQHYPVAGDSKSPTYFWLGNYPVPPIYQGMGWSGETAVQIAARFQTDALNLLQPGAWVLINGGINDTDGCDINAGCTPAQIATIETALTSMMAAAQTAGLRTFVMLLGPHDTPNGSNARMASEDTLDSWLLAVAPGYGATPVDYRCTLGQFRSGGSAGNCWDYQPAYLYGDGLGIHPNQAGVQLIGNLIYAAFPYAASNSKTATGASGASGWNGGLF
jgi:lysophospholipase L1-like esterase